MQTIVISGTSLAWPARCACCLKPALEQVAVQHTQSTFLVVATYKKTLTRQVPYCAECAAQVRAATAMTGWVKALLVFMGLWFGCTFAGALLGIVVQQFARPLSVLILPLLSCVAPFVG